MKVRSWRLRDCRLRVRRVIFMGLMKAIPTGTGTCVLPRDGTQTLNAESDEVFFDKQKDIYPIPARVLPAFPTTSNFVHRAFLYGVYITQCLH